MAIKKAQPDTIHIEPLKQGRIKVRLIGTMPLYFHAMSQKAKRSLLVGAAKKTAAEKRAIKHNPEEEYRESVYTSHIGDTLLCFPATAIKGAMSTAALETAGITKTSVQRRIFIPQQTVQIWGKPFLKMDIVRSADIAKTPDIRTRAFLPRWCAEVDIAFAIPTFSAQSIVSILANAGVVVGIGDFRQEKGRGGFGTFAVAGGEDMGEWAQEWAEITKEGRDVQAEAMENPECADADTEQLYEFLTEERKRRAA